MAVLDFLFKKKDPYQVQISGYDQFGLPTYEQKKGDVQLSGNIPLNAQDTQKSGLYLQTNNATGSNLAKSGAKAPQETETPSQFIQRVSGQYTDNKTPTQSSQQPQSTNLLGSTSVPNVSNLFSKPKTDYSGTYDILNQRQNRLGETYKSTQDYLENSYNLQNQYLKSQIPTLQQGYNTLATEVEASKADQQRLADRQSRDVEERSGEAQRQAALTRRESEGRLRNIFAARGTLSGRGAGSYASAASELENNFNQFTYKNLQNKLDQLDDIDNNLSQFMRQADALLNQEQAKLQQAINQINAQVGMNENEKQYALRQTKANYDANIENVALTIEQLKMAESQVQNEIEQDLSIFENLSDTFLTTGQPANRYDAFWMTQNPDAYKTIASSVSSGQSGDLTEQQRKLQGASDLTQRALELLGTGQVASGFGQGTLGKVGETFGTNSQNQQDYRSTIALLRTAVRNALLGANMTDKEMESVMAAIPEYSDAPNIAKQKLENLYANLPVLAGTGGVQSALGQQPDLSSFIE